MIYVILYLVLTYALNFVFLMFKEKNGIDYFCQTDAYDETFFKTQEERLAAYYVFSPLNVPLLIFCMILAAAYFCLEKISLWVVRHATTDLFRKDDIESLKKRLAELEKEAK